MFGQRLTGRELPVLPVGVGLQSEAGLEDEVHCGFEGDVNAVVLAHGEKPNTVQDFA